MCILRVTARQKQLISERSPDNAIKRLCIRYGTTADSNLPNGRSGSKVSFSTAPRENPSRAALRAPPAYISHIGRIKVTFRSNV